MTTKLPTSQAEFGNMIYACIDLSEYDEGATLKNIICAEKHVYRLTTNVVEDWLRGLPGACTIPYWDNEILEILESTGNCHWSIDEYWRWAANRVKFFAEYPKAFA